MVPYLVEETLLSISILYDFTLILVLDMHTSGFGGLVVSMLASGTQDRGFDPGRSRRIFRAKKIHSMPSLGGK